MTGKFSVKGNSKLSSNKKNKLTSEEYIKQSKTKDPSFEGRKNYKRISFNLPPELITKIREYSTNLKNSGKKDSGMSTLVAEACINYLISKRINVEHNIILEKNIK